MHVKKGRGHRKDNPDWERIPGGGGLTNKGPGGLVPNKAGKEEYP